MFVIARFSTLIGASTGVDSDDGGGASEGHAIDFGEAVSFKVRFDSFDEDCCDAASVVAREGAIERTHGATLSFFTTTPNERRSLVDSEAFFNAAALFAAMVSRLSASVAEIKCRVQDLSKTGYGQIANSDNDC